jgi:hypothetical protein
VARRPSPPASRHSPPTSPTRPTRIDALSADPSKYLGVDGQINDDAIRTDLADVLTRKPHWRRSTETPGPRLPAPNAAQGTGGAASTDPATQFASLIQGQLRS